MTTARTLGAVALVLATAPASAGTISGTITEQGVGPLAGAEVRAWRLGPKGYSIVQTASSAGGTGAYSFTVTAGSYLIDVRGPAAGTNYGDRWYDAVAPLGSGYVGEVADVIVATAASSATGVDVALQVLGGTDGVVLRSGAVPAPSMWGRLERRGEIRIHHNDFTKTPTGLVSMRGMVPATDYQLMVYDPVGARDLLLVPGPFTITSNTNGSLGDLTMADAPADPYEGNNTANCGATSISAAALHADPPLPWTSAGARVGPLAPGDVDWYCFTAVDGDRLILTTSTELVVAGVTRKHPWTDPMLSFWRGARGTRLVDDDDGGGGLDARVDTGPLTAGCHCAAVSTFGDANYLGASQGSSGAYVLRAVQGNRPPVPSIKKGATEVPAAPATFMIDEGDTLALNLSFVDADHDVPTRSFTHLDSGGAAVPGGTLTLGASTGTYTWLVPADGAMGSPYTLRLQAADPEFTMTKTVIVVVNAVDSPPPVPVPLSPIGGAVVATGAPPLRWTNAADPDGDVVSYDVELYLGPASGPPTQIATGVAEDASGTTSWTPTTIPENTRATWRVRARTTAMGGLSPWSDYGRFLVDTANDAPPVPVLIKPSEGELLAMRRPGLSALNVEDPEDDDVELRFEVARDGAFTDLVWTSPGVPQNPVSATTIVGTGVDLAWGGTYWVRARARDVRGGESAWSDAHGFRLKLNAPPGNPAFEGGCTATTYLEAPDAIVVRNVQDPEGEAVRFELEMFRFDDDPTASFPVYTTSAVMATGAAVTSIPLDLSGLDNGRYRYRVRAFDGTDASEVIECELTLDVPAAGQPGGCCDAGGPPAGPALLALAAAVALTRRRRRA